MNKFESDKLISGSFAYWGMVFKNFSSIRGLEYLPVNNQLT